jgi:tetratricopeptide (TPR) repeat protein
LCGIYYGYLFPEGGFVADLHITQDMLDGVSRGELPPRVLTELGLKHLLSLCPHCRAEFRAWQRGRTGQGSYDAAFQILPALLQHQTQGLEKMEEEARRDLRALLRMSFEDRLARIRRAHRHFRSAFLAGLILEEARRHIPAEPTAVYELAETAHAILLRTPESPTASDLSVRAAIYAGNALRAQGDLPAADKRFAIARGIITARGVIDTLVCAEVDWFEGTLRKDQRRFQEAEDLLTRAIALYRLAGDYASAIYPLGALGILYYKRQEYPKAIDTFRAALSQGTPEADPRFFCYLHHNLTLTLCDQGNYDAAGEALRTGQQLYAACPDAYTQARLTWIEGKIALGVGRLGSAEEAFLGVRGGFVVEGNGYDVAMVSLDLALVYAKQGRGKDLKKLAEETHSLFETLEIHREALSALLLFGQAAREERLTAERIEDFIRYFRKARANPSLRFR